MNLFQIQITVALITMVDTVRHAITDKYRRNTIHSYAIEVQFSATEAIEKSGTYSFIRQITALR